MSLTLTINLKASATAPARAFEINPGLRLWEALKVARIDPATIAEVELTAPGRATIKLASGSRVDVAEAHAFRFPELASDVDFLRRRLWRLINGAQARKEATLTALERACEAWRAA